MICVVIFTVSSVFCGMASSLAFLIVFRVLQGGGGGGLQPMAQAILADTFPPEKRGLAFSLYGVTAVLAPSLGPTLGGWITDNYSWRWIFFINLPVGLITLFLIHRLVEDPPYVAKARRARIKVDYIGISLLVVGLGCLQVLLDKGEQEDWFGSNLIVTLTVLSVISLVALVIWEWQQDQPVLDVRLFKNFNYASSNLMMFMLGLILFGSIVMLPQFTQGLLGYTAETSGMVLSPGGFVILCLLPFVGRLLSVVPAKLLILFGWCVLAFSLFYSTHINAQLDFRHAAMLRIVQSLGLPFLFIPVTTLAYIGIPKEKNNAVAGTINLMRNLGSSFGTSIVTTLLAERTQRHQKSPGGEHNTVQSALALICPVPFAAVAQ
jgi:DHA2 family multidrug resistance protein